MTNQKNEKKNFLFNIDLKYAKTSQKTLLIDIAKHLDDYFHVSEIKQNFHIQFVKKPTGKRHFKTDFYKFFSFFLFNMGKSDCI